MAKDLRPVFPEERLLLEILLNKKPHEFIEQSVWAADSRYYINGKSIALSSKLFQEADADAISRQLDVHQADNTYAYFRYNDTDLVFVFINNSDKDVKLTWSRFAEINAGLSEGRDVLTGDVVTLSDDTVVPANTALVVEYKR
jgi:phosphoadenosine phosphosulfate reductase